jgi:hypothetical protein
VSKSIYLVDFENVQIKSEEALKAADCLIYIFCGENQNKLQLELVQSLQPFGPSVKYIKISGTGSNALDFHIAFYIGQLACQHAEAAFHIVSKDTGFDPLVKHLASVGIRCTRITTIGGTHRPVNGTSTEKATKNVATTKPKCTPDPETKTNRALVENQSSGNSSAKPVTENLPASQYASEVVKRLKGLKKAKPATLKTLNSSIKSWLKPTPSEKTVKEIVQSLKDGNKIAITGTKLAYKVD